ncbi:hypothetical protein TSUD_368660 [Trifolium subterraneum]|uniref:PTC1-like winged helix-turn-helix domain-containing protein n=1 Tax=Trifolium subterraneum TaxID=3900 RepID=A0A2Z6P3M8_TRISU|nr:hypothetical protein TSUD_368660 [Trifolium subterraneum]
MGIEFAIKTLCKSIKADEFAQKRNSVINDDAAKLVSKQGSCWSQLKFAGMIQWGQRRQVRFLGRHENQKVQSLRQPRKEKGVIFEGRTNKKRKNVEDEIMAVKVAPFRVLRTRMTRQCNQQGVSSSIGVKKSKKEVDDTKMQQLVLHGKNKGKMLIDRWCAKRYTSAEESVLKIMKEKEAVYGNPIMRSDLRKEARKYIGDTGLLDHLLKHMAGKVAPGGVERFRRRHNAEGSMEYWLENADLVDIRKELGVQDTYWTPPPGWKPGDSISPDHVTSNELRMIRDEIIKLKREMQELASKQEEEEEALAIVATPSPTSCFSSMNCEDYGSHVSKQDIYVNLVHRKAKIEEQLKEISLAMSVMEDQLGMLKPTVVQEPIMSESSTPPALLLGQEASEDVKGTNDKETKSADTQMVLSSKAELRAAKIERLKSGFKICKPKGTFIWPNMSVSPNLLTNLDEHTMVQTPTPTSAPKLVLKSQTQNLTLSLLNPSSPIIKPLAERRTVSTATLTYVTGTFSPYLSSPLETPKTTISTTITKSGSSVNLNETPLRLE